MKKRACLFLSVLCCTASVFSEVREHGGHVHGQGSISIAFDGIQGTIELDTPGDAVLGFEHEAKSKKDKQKQADALKKLETEISRMVVFDEALGCVITPKKMEVKHDGAHADLEAEFQVSCKTSPLGSKILFQVQKVFPGFHQVAVQVLVGNVQKKVVVKKNGVSVDLK